MEQSKHKSSKKNKVRIHSSPCDQKCLPSFAKRYTICRCIIIAVAKIKVQQSSIYVCVTKKTCTCPGTREEKNGSKSMCKMYEVFSVFDFYFAVNFHPPMDPWWGQRRWRWSTPTRRTFALCLAASARSKNKTSANHNRMDLWLGMAGLAAARTKRQESH